MSGIGIISGSGLNEIKGLTVKKSVKITTPFGKPSDKYIIGNIGNTEVIFLPRHGSQHNLPPHMINCKANIWGFKKLGVERIISVSAVGGIKKGLRPGNIVVLDQVIDMTKSRESTFYDGKAIILMELVPWTQSLGEVVHIDFTEPYCHELRKIILKAGKLSKTPLKNSGTYLAVEGPRLETASEIRAFGILGGDVIGMTGMPEASLARELEICYSGISVVANYAAGITKRKLTTKEVIDEMSASTEKIKKLLKQTFKIIPKQRKCSCKEALKNAKI